MPLSRSPLRLVIFDCDGVLIDSEPICNRVVAAMLTSLGWEMTPETCERMFIGMSFHSMRPLIEARLHHGLPRTWEADLAARVAGVMAREAMAIPGAERAVRAVEALGLDWRVASNSSHREMEAKFGRTGLAALVAGRLHSVEDMIAEGRPGKPAPNLFLSAACSAGAEPGACLVLEDSVLGARGAAAAGMMCWALCPNGAGAALAAEGALPFRSLAEFPALLRTEIRRRARQ